MWFWIINKMIEIVSGMTEFQERDRNQCPEYQEQSWFKVLAVPVFPFDWCKISFA
jgi:hypothetical protein